jgi:hypothetical protein
MSQIKTKKALACLSGNKKKKLLVEFEEKINLRRILVSICKSPKKECTRWHKKIKALTPLLLTL